MSLTLAMPLRIVINEWWPQLPFKICEKREKWLKYKKKRDVVRLSMRQPFIIDQKHQNKLKAYEGC